MAALPQHALRGAKWFCSPVCWARVFAPILATAGGNTMQDPARAPVYSYLGHEVVITNSLSSSTSSLDGQVMLLFGNAMQSSLFGSRQEIRIGLSGERWFELDLIGVRASERFHIVNPPSVLGDGTTAGPMIGLIGNA